MGTTKADLETKLIEMYPEITKFGLSLALDFDEGKNAWLVTFEKGRHRRHAYLDKSDADACMEGDVCLYLGVLIAQYIKAIEAQIEADR